MKFNYKEIGTFNSEKATKALIELYNKTNKVNKNKTGKKPDKVS